MISNIHILNLSKLKIIDQSPVFLSLAPKFLTFQWMLGYCDNFKFSTVWGLCISFFEVNTNLAVQWTLRAQNGCSLQINHKHATAPVALYIGLNSASVSPLFHKEAQRSCSLHLQTLHSLFPAFQIITCLQEINGDVGLTCSSRSVQRFFHFWMTLSFIQPTLIDCICQDCNCHGRLYWDICCFSLSGLSTDFQPLTPLLCCS